MYFKREAFNEKGQKNEFQPEFHTIYDNRF